MFKCEDPGASITSDISVSSGDDSGTLERFILRLPMNNHVYGKHEKIMPGNFVSISTKGVILCDVNFGR